MDNNCSNSTKQLKQVLGFWDLMGASVGQIIGAGIMTLLGSALGMTGRSVPIAFLIAFIITVCQFIPQILISGTVRCRGGRYSMVAMLSGDKIAGAYSIIYIFSNLSLSMYALSFASYVVSLLGVGSEQVIGFIILTLFFGLNIMGIDKFAKVQNVIVFCLVIALVMFSAFGITKVDFGGYMDPEQWMTGGAMGLLQAGGLLTFATGGATCIIDLSAESKNPTRDIPTVMVVSTFLVAIVYAFMAIVAAGVFPVSEVANQNLAKVAAEILPRPLYIFFMIGGAGFALISTLNAQFAWAPKPTMQACDDGWLPTGLAKLSKWNTPYIILVTLYIIAAVCIATGLSVSILGNMCVVASGITTMMINFSVFRLPKVAPKEWENSKFKVGPTTLYLVAAIGTLASAFNVYLNASRLPKNLLMINAVVIVAALIFGTVRSKHAHIQVSFEAVGGDNCGCDDQK